MKVRNGYVKKALYRCTMSILIDFLISIRSHRTDINNNFITIESIPHDFNISRLSRFGWISMPNLRYAQLLVAELFEEGKEPGVSLQRMR